MTSFAFFTLRNGRLRSSSLCYSSALKPLQLGSLISSSSTRPSQRHLSPYYSSRPASTSTSTSKPKPRAPVHSRSSTQASTAAFPSPSPSTSSPPTPTPTSAFATKPPTNIPTAFPPTLNPKTNPPSTTLPPPLSPPTRTPSQSAIKHYLSLGRSYLTFYKSALKNIYTTSKTSFSLLRRASLSPYTTSTATLLSAAVKNGALNRAELQTVLRSRSDVRRIPLFALLFCACGEFTPLLVPFVGGVVPRSAWIPLQVEKARGKSEERRRGSFREGTLIEDSAALVGGNENGNGGGIGIGRLKVEELSERQLRHISISLGLHSRLWEILWDRPPLWIVRGRVQGRVGYLEADDMALVRDSGGKTARVVEELGLDEVVRAAEERGIDVQGRKEGDVRKVLGEWMGARFEEGAGKGERGGGKGVGVPALLLVRPEGWEGILGHEGKNSG